MKHAIRHIHFVEYSEAQPKPGLCRAVPANAMKCGEGLMS
jgi:hypothetical protein